VTALSPIYFWAFLSLIPLIGIYFLKVRPHRKSTTAYFLWEKIFQEKRTSSLFRRLRDVLSLLLMLLAFSAVVLALTNPQSTSDDRKDALILIDHSASMNATEQGTTRLARAKDIASEIVQAFNGTQRAAVATVAHDLVYRSHLTDNPRQLLDAIEEVDATDFAMRSELITNSFNEAAGRGDHRIILISDGCFGAADLPEGVELFKVGESQENVGIVAADARYLPGEVGQLAIYFQVASSHEEPVQAELLVSRLDDEGGSELLRLVPLDIQPGVNKSQVYKIENAEPGRWQIALDVEDALRADNVAYLAVERPRPVRVAVKSDDRFFFENSVVAFSGGGGLLQLTDQRPQIVLAKSTTPQAERSLIFQPQGESPFWSELGEELEEVAPRLLIEDHPALRFVDAMSMPFVGARRLKAPEGAQVWVASDEGVPLIYRTTAAGRTAIVVNMDPVAAEFYFSAWFPVLVHSTATHLAGREESLQATYPPNRVVTIPGLTTDTAVEVVDPQGEAQQTDGKSLRLRDLGFYETSNESGDWRIACSLLSSKDTMLDNAEVEDSSKPISRGWLPAQLLTMLAIVVLTGESLLYQRRKVG